MAFARARVAIQAQLNDETIAGPVWQQGAIGEQHDERPSETEESVRNSQAGEVHQYENELQAHRATETSSGSGEINVNGQELECAICWDGLAAVSCVL